MVGDRSNPSIFYECLNDGLAYRFHCPKGLIFSEEAKACIYDVNNPVTFPPPISKSKFDCSHRKDALYQDKSDPTKFHECVNGIAYDFGCPPETVFEEKRQVCVYDDDWQTRTHASTEGTDAPTTEGTDRKSVV